MNYLMILITFIFNEIYTKKNLSNFFFLIALNYIRFNINIYILIYII